MATTGYTVVVFKHIQFQGNWSRSIGTDCVVYTATVPQNAVVYILAEDHAGHNVTYAFVSKGREWPVYVYYGGDAQAHIPVLYREVKDGNKL
ncbi:MAG TPA: hypothetical protein VFJ90_08055 [Candidatus Didemnitutus sp.]|nr:hypothetical protein [Candidatus Didemnitutus sp.]